MNRPVLSRRWPRAALSSVILVAAGCAGMVEDDEIFGTTSVTVGSTYHLVRKGSGDCLDIAGAASANGTNVRQWSCSDSDGQSFRVEDAGGGTVRLVNPASDKCVDISGAGTANGTNIQLWTCNSSGAQSFTIEDVGSGYSRLRNPHSGKCLDVNGGADGDGVNVQLWTCNTSDAQKWQFKSVSDGDTVYFSNDGVKAGWSSATPQGGTIGRVVEVTSPTFKTSTAILTEQTYVRPQGAHSETILANAQRNGEDRYYGQAIYLSADWSFIDKNATFQQFSPENPAGPWMLNWIQNDHIFIRVAGTHYDCGPIKKGEWTRVVVRFKTTNPGIFEYWVNGIKKWSITDKDLTIKDGSPSMRWSSGIYVTWWRDQDPGPQLTRGIYHDQLRVAASYEAADPASW